MNTDYDVLIVGGGLVGLALASVLAGQSHRVRVLEAGSTFSEPLEPGLRVSAISPSSQSLLNAIGAWGGVPQSLRSPFSRMRVWDEDVAPFSDRSLEFAGVDFGVSPLGTIVHNDALQWALFECGVAAGVDVVFDSRVEDIVYETDGVRVFCADQQHTARLLIGADGARSHVRELSHIEVAKNSYKQQGIVCNVRTEHAHEYTAWQRFLRTGPVALLPLSSGECSIVWSVDNEGAIKLKELDDAAFGQALSRACDHVLGDMQVASERASFPLTWLRAHKYSSERMALIGDAAHVVHPLAGQGVNLGFGDVATLAGALEERAARGDQIGDRYALRRYERARKYENRKMQMTVDGLHHLFTAEQGWIRQGRSLGMGLLNQWPSIKGRLAREALGTTTS